MNEEARRKVEEINATHEEFKRGLEGLYRELTTVQVSRTLNAMEIIMEMAMDGKITMEEHEGQRKILMAEYKADRKELDEAFKTVGETMGHWHDDIVSFFSRED